MVQVMATMPNEDNVHQLWMIKPVNHKKVELVHFCTDDVIDCEGEEVKLTRGRQKIEQLFEIEEPKFNKPMEDNSEMVRLKAYNGSYLSLEGILSLEKYS